MNSPFWWVGVLIRKSLNSHISLCGIQQDNRAIAVKLDYNGLHVICVGVYLPADRIVVQIILIQSVVSMFLLILLLIIILATHLSFLVISTFNVWLVIKVMFFR